MIVRQRAVQAGDKQERHHAILDAAEQLLLRSPERIANMAEVADQAGLAKGTVYLYFPSKEELLLALHERNVDGFFQALLALLERKSGVTIADVNALTRTHIVAPPLFLPLASRCFAVMDKNVPVDAARAFKQRMAERLERAGTGLERHFPKLPAGGGVVLLRHSYALILGLWQMAGEASNRGAGAATAPESKVFGWGYADDLAAALGALWEGTLARVARGGNPR
ncbi:MAG: TetR family transcriptional regulator [Casimicrobiaceae bacterium]